MNKVKLIRSIERFAENQQISFEDALELLKDAYHNDIHNIVVLINVDNMSELSQRVKKILKQNNLKTSYDLHGLNQSVFLKMVGFSKKSLLELKEAAEVHGFLIRE